MKRIVQIVLLAWAGVCLAQDSEPAIDGKPLAELLKQLRSDNRGFQLRAAQSLAKSPKELHEKIVPQLISVLGSARENDKFVAAQVLGEYGVVARSAIPDLLPMLAGTQYERNRAAAARALGQILKDAPANDEVEKVTQALIAVFPDKYSDVRREAVEACGMIGPAAKSCIPHLPRMFDDEKHNGAGTASSHRYMIQSAAAWTAGRMGPLAACHIDRLVAILHGPDVATTAVWAIGEIGAVNENVIPNLTDRLEKAIYGGQWGGFGAHAFSHCVGPVVEGTKEEYRDFCFAVLAKFGGKSKSAVPLMIRIISEETISGDRIRDATGALRVLRALGPEAKDALPALEKAVGITTFHSRIPAAAVEAFQAEARAALAAVKGGKATSRQGEP